MSIETLAQGVAEIEKALLLFDPAREPAWPSDRVLEMSDQIVRLRNDVMTSSRSYSDLYQACLITPFRNPLVRHRYFDPSFIRAREMAEIDRARTAIRKLADKLRVEMEIRCGTGVVTVVRCDYVGYQLAANAIDDVLGSEGTRAFQKNIRESALDIVLSIGVDPHHALLKADGDCVWLRFVSADLALAFLAGFAAASEHAGTGTGKRFGMQRFRTGVATGAISPDPLADDKIDFAGVVMTLATRLEGAADIGGALIDVATWEAASAASRQPFLPLATVATKHGLSFRAARLPPRP